MICSASITIKSSKKHLHLKWAWEAQAVAGRRAGHRSMLRYDVCSPGPCPWAPQTWLSAV